MKEAKKLNTNKFLKFIIILICEKMKVMNNKEKYTKKMFL